MCYCYGRWNYRGKLSTGYTRWSTLFLQLSAVYHYGKIKSFVVFFFKGEGLVAEKEGKVGGRGREGEESWRKRGERG